MAYFPSSGSSRLVQVRAIGGKFPYYGALETEPATAVRDFQRRADALVDDKVMLQFNAQVGDRVRIGEQDFRIAGKLRKIPGEALAFSLISPRVYIPLGYLRQTQLVQKGSLVRYRVYFRFDSHVDVDQLVRRISPQLQRLGLQADTVSRRTEAISASMDNLSRYLRLAVFIAVLLAGVGVASGVHVYVKEKIPSVAVLRCIGANPRETVIVYLTHWFPVRSRARAMAIFLIGTPIAQLVSPKICNALLPFGTTTSIEGVTIKSGTSCSFSKPSAQMPMMKPSRLKVTEVSTRKTTIQMGCMIESGTNSAAVARMMSPRPIDLVAAAPT